MKRSGITSFSVLLFVPVFLLLSAPAFPDIIHADDVIINGGSACIGFDCQNGEVFDQDTLRLEENNLRIHFQDTSTTAAFPANDWRILINDTANGGMNYFSIEDSTGGVRPFTILAGAGANSLFVDGAGNVGVGTASPTEKLHVDGNVFVLGNLELGSSRQYKSGIQPLDVEEAMKALEELRPVKYRHMSSPDEESIGFIAEDVPDLVATSSRKSLSPVDLVAVLTRVVQEQQRTIGTLSRRLGELEKKTNTTANR